MSERNQPKSIKERIAICPIHKWADIDDYLKRAKVPQQLNQPFHELVLGRGQHPKNMSLDQSRQFGDRAVEIIRQYEIRPVEAQAIQIIFVQLIDQWIGVGSQNN